MKKNTILSLILICLAFSVSARKYGNPPSDGYIKISVVDSNGNSIAESPTYYLQSYTYKENSKHTLTIRFPEAYSVDRRGNIINFYEGNNDNFNGLKNWIEQTEEHMDVDLCKKITRIFNWIRNFGPRCSRLGYFNSYYNNYDGYLYNYQFIFKKADMTTSTPKKGEDTSNTKIIVCHSTKHN